jgi:hypothetical protein
MLSVSLCLLCAASPADVAALPDEKHQERD